MFGFSRKKIFSIIIPVYNGKKTLERTLASFISNKEYIKQIVIIDDCSVDNTGSIVEKWKQYNFFDILYSRNKERVGPGISRKKGIELSTGKWITFVDADDCLTASSLKYVYNNIKVNKNIVVVHTKTIYYESGSFNPDSIDYSDTSCGGNFYNKKYLVDNNIYPHDTLPLVEDQYFNEKLMYYIDYCDNNGDEKIGHFDYPVYEVHHDTDQGYSYALRNWEDYCVRYRLLYKQYLIDDFIDMALENNNEELYEDILVDYITNFIFCFYLAIGLKYDNDINYDFESEHNQELFRNALLYYSDVIDRNPEEIIIYYNENMDIIDDIVKETFSTIGFEYDIEYSFEEFVRNLLLQ